MLETYFDIDRIYIRWIKLEMVYNYLNERGNLMEPRLKRKIIWLDEWNVREQEAWFSDMALEGWKLIKLGAVFATFEESDPREVTYRGDIFNLDSHSDQHRIELYRKSGWEFVDSRRHIQIFRESEDGEVSEVYATPAERAETLSLLQKKIKNRAWIAIISSIVMILLNYSTLRIDPAGNYLRDDLIPPISSIIIYIFVAIHMIIGTIHMRKLIKQLKLAEADDGYTNYRWKVNRKKLFSISGAIIIGSSAVLAIIAISKTNERDWYIEIPQGDLPVVQLSDIMNEAKYERVTIPEDYGLYDNGYKGNSSILVPQQYELHESVFVDGNDTDRLTITSYLYEGKSEWIAQRLAQVLSAEYAGPQIVYELVSHEKFDMFWLGENHSNLVIIVKKDNKVYHFRYNGKGLNEEKVKKILLKIGEKL